jgi:diguanylate cyclase
MASRLQSYLDGALSQTSIPVAMQVIAQIVSDQKTELVNHFYNFMVDDPEASRFLSVQAVEAHLKPGLARWLEMLFCHDDEEHLEASLAMQRHIGEVHARADIPMNLVARGMRLLKHEIKSRLYATDITREVLFIATSRVDHIFEYAFEEMSTAFVQSREKGVRVDESYRMFSASQNLSLEREKQISSILEWESRLFRALLIEGDFGTVFRISESSFGLWLHHKAPLIFDEDAEIASIDECIQRVDSNLYPQIVAGGDRGPSSVIAPDTLKQLVRKIQSEVEKIKFLVQTMFERITDLEVGRDSLTHLFNRRFLDTILKKEISLSAKKGTTFGIMMIDIDFFKKVNDEYGHDAGDRVLQGVASLLISQVRASDFVFRYGGEEFLVMLAEVNADQVKGLGEKIRTRVEQTSFALSSEQSIKVTLSIGIAMHEGHPDYQNIINRADEALYAAKRGGRNRCIFTGEY